jgi:hypothetical protein
MFAKTLLLAALGFMAFPAYAGNDWIDDPNSDLSNVFSKNPTHSLADITDAAPSRGTSFMAIDRYESTFVVEINGNGDFTDLQPAISALPARGGKIFVTAGVYPITSTITITGSDVQIQGRGNGHYRFRRR